MTGSFVLWYEPKNKEIKKEVSIEVHVNFLKDRIKNKIGLRKKNYTFDFGFMIDDLDNISTINLIVPFSIHNAPDDLGKTIADHNELVSALFNESYSANHFFLS